MKDLKKYLQDFAGRKILMVIYPHPDDETMAAGGILLEAKRLGFKTVVVCLTLGEAGENHAPDKGKKLSEIRRQELGRALEILGVDSLEPGDFGDGKLRGSEKKWGPWVYKMIKKYNPGVVVTYDHSGLYGHPDHIALSLAVSHPVLFWSTLSKEYYERLDFTKEVREFITEPTHSLDLGLDFWKKYKAAMAHKTQKLGKGLPIPLWAAFALYNKEWYHQVDPKRKYKFKYLERTF